jgi:EAL domain-containing protein (putative c-di-GMP-specific phosphodiesterase class I)
MTTATAPAPLFGNQTIEPELLRRAPSDGSLEMVYQPELELDSGAIVAMEGLVRWRHPVLGQLKPADFLRIANETGAIADIDAWVLRAGAAEVASWQTLRGPSRHLWLNVSLAQLRRPGFAQSVAELVKEFGLAEGVLGLEISEKSILDLGANARPLLVQLRRAGVSLAIDDFTSYYATLGAIASLPIDCVKIAHRYIRDIGDGRHDDTFVATVIERAHTRGIYVVAEGVETWGESARLTELGCDRAHGYLFSSAQRPDRARWLLTQGTGWRGQAVTPEVHAIPFPSPPAPTS